MPLSPIGNYIYDPQIFFTNRTVRTIREAIFSSYGPYDSYGSTNYSKFHLVTSCLFHLLETIFTIRESFSRTVRFVRSVKPFSVRTVCAIRKSFLRTVRTVQIVSEYFTIFTICIRLTVLDNHQFLRVEATRASCGQHWHRIV